MTITFFPAHHELYESVLSVEEVLNLVDALTSQEQTLTAFVFATGNEPWYMGEVDGRTFRIRRRLAYRNHFQPNIQGDVYPVRNKGAEVDLRMDLPPFVKVFMAVWLGVCGLHLTTADVPEAIHLWRLGFAFDWSVLAPLLLAVVGYLFMAGAFYLEVRISLKHLTKALQLRQLL